MLLFVAIAMWLGLNAGLAGAAVWLARAGGVSAINS